MKVGLRILTTAESTEQQMIDALDEIIEWCENLDFAAGKNMYYRKQIFRLWEIHKYRLILKPQSLK